MDEHADYRVLAPAAFVWRVQQIAAQMEASEQRQLARWEPQ